MSNDYETDDFLPITKVDWKFDSVPDDELVACCLWEYARESHSFKLASQIAWANTRHILHREAYKNDPQLKAAHDEEAARIARSAKAAGFDYETFGNTFWDSDLASIDIYQSLKSYIGDGGRAWQLVPPQGRKRLAKEVSQGACLRPLADAMVGQLEALWNANRKELDEVRARVLPADDDSEDAALWTETKPLNLKQGNSVLNDGTAAAFVIDFSRFTDKEIADAFISWLKATRPKEWRSPRRVFPDSKKKGRKRIEFTVALERLGLMRLLHWYSPEEMRHDVPAAWVKYGKKKKDFRREVREATKFFRKLFPFLPPGERPSSETRKGVWSAEMMAICDELEKEMPSGVRA